MKTNNQLSPGEDGIVAAKEDAKKIAFMERLCDDFKSFVVEAVSDGHAENSGDHFEFLQMCLEAYIDLNISEDV